MMILKRHKYIFRSIVAVITVFMFSLQQLHAQQQPPRPITVFINPNQGLIFGAFFLGASGGSVIVFPNGSRTATGSVVLANMGYPFSPAMFEITANRGTLVSILNGPDVLLTGSNGGSISLHVGASSAGNTFITTATPPAVNQVLIGGTLTVGNTMANPPGNYSGIFSVTFIQE